MSELREPRWGMIHVYTGGGKGKTTAALGLAIRAAAVGKRVAWVAFDKGGEDHYSERSLIRERIPEIELHVTGLDRIDPASGKFRFGVTPEDVKEGDRGLNIVRRLMAEGTWDLLVLDEANISTRLGILDENEVLDTIRNKPATMELVLTGRDAPDSFLKLADLVTEMRPAKHYYQQGIAARKGLDF
jgi:cob(I)alamin adenosyltransferase